MCLVLDDARDGGSGLMSIGASSCLTEWNPKFVHYVGKAIKVIYKISQRFQVQKLALNLLHSILSCIIMSY